MDNLIKKIDRESEMKMNPYFVSMREGNFQKDDFVETQIQFYFAVTFFSRPMSILASRVPTAELRLEILRNVWEEHGEGNLLLTHSNTFLDFLNQLAKIGLDDISKRALWPAVRAFNTSLIGACSIDEYLVGVGVMGMIERMFSSVSKWIGKEVVNHFWVPASELVHYDVHTSLDIKHSDDFFNVLRPAWEQNIENRYYIEQGLRLGGFLFYSLYENLYKSRECRIFREIQGPHIRF